MFVLQQADPIRSVTLPCHGYACVSSSDKFNLFMCTSTYGFCDALCYITKMKYNDIELSSN